MKEDPDHPDLQELEEKFYEMERAESRVCLAQFDSEPFLILVSGGGGWFHRRTGSLGA
jgi:hypothetical protein